MLWSPLMFLTVLCGVICEIRLMDNRFKRPALASKNTAAIPSNELTGKHIGDLPPCRQDDNNFMDIYGLKECDNVGKDATNSNDYDIGMENTKRRREFLTGTSRNLASSDILSDIMAMDIAAMRFGNVLPISSAKTAKDKKNNMQQEGLGEGDSVNAAVLSSSATSSSTYLIDYTDEKIDNESQETLNKRANSAPVIGCDCKIKNDVIDLGQQHFPRYLLNAVCQSKTAMGYSQKCWRGSHCKPLEYNVKVLKPRNIMDQTQKEPALAWLPDDLRPFWIFETVTVAAGCFCSY